MKLAEGEKKALSLAASCHCGSLRRLAYRIEEITVGQYVLVLLFTSFFAIPLARQRFFYSTALARLKVKGVTLYFLNNVFLLNLTLKPT